MERFWTVLSGQPISGNDAGITCFQLGEWRGRKNVTQCRSPMNSILNTGCPQAILLGFCIDLLAGIAYHGRNEEREGELITCYLL
jgi:hypothetical protein